MTLRLIELAIGVVAIVVLLAVMIRGGRAKSHPEAAGRRTPTWVVVLLILVLAVFIPLRAFT